MALPLRSVPCPTTLDLDPHVEGIDLDFSRVSLVNGDREFMSITLDNFEDVLDTYQAMCVENNWKLIKWDAWS